MVGQRNCGKPQGSTLSGSNDADEVLSTVSSKLTVTLRDEGQTCSISRTDTLIMQEAGSDVASRAQLALENHLFDMEDNISKLAAHLGILEDQLRAERKERKRTKEMLSVAEEERDIYKQQAQECKQELYALQRICATNENEVAKWKALALEEISKAFEKENDRKNVSKHQTDSHGCSCVRKESENMNNIIDSLNNSVEMLKIGMANAFGNHAQPEEPSQSNTFHPKFGTKKLSSVPVLAVKRVGNGTKSPKTGIVHGSKISSAKGGNSGTTHSKSIDSNLGVPQAHSTLVRGQGAKPKNTVKNTTTDKGICRCRNVNNKE